MPVELNIEGGVAWLRLGRPQALNALDAATISELRSHLTTLAQRADVRVVVTTGEGRSFCAGSDLRQLATADSRAAEEFEKATASVCAQLAALPQPSFALIHGHALGGGLGLALYHDFRIAADDACLGMPEVALGWVPPWAVGRLVSVVGPAQAKWLLLSGENISGSRAAAIGLVHESVSASDLTARGRARAEAVAAMPYRAAQETKRLVDRVAPAEDSRWDRAALELFVGGFGQPEAKASLRRFARP